jgi:hypothetical protein
VTSEDIQATLATQLSPSTASATGTGKLAVNMTTGAIGGAVVYSGLQSSTTATGGLIRQSSNNADIVILTGGTGTAGKWSVPAGAILTAPQLNTLQNNGMYFVVLSQGLLSGELRGNIVFPAKTLTTAMSPLVGSGSGSGTLTIQLGTGAVSGSITFTGLTSNATAAQVRQSSDDSTVFALTGGSGAAAGAFTVPAGTFLNGAQIKTLLNNGYHFAVQTQSYPAGELKGFLVHPFTTIPAVTLNGSQEVPPVSTTGSGSAGLTVNIATGQISGTVTFSGLQSASSAAHIHVGSSGENGPIAVALQGGEGQTAGTWTVPANRFMTSSQLGALISDGMYVNIHTANNPNGEIRGQITGVPLN